MSWPALLITALVATALAAAIIISVENWTHLEPALTRWGWIGALMIAAINLWMAFDRWVSGETTKATIFGMGSILLLTIALVEYRRTRQQSGR